MKSPQSFKMKTTISLVSLGVISLWGGCAGQEQAVVQPSNACSAFYLVKQGQAPEWIIKPQLFSGDGMVYGVGNTDMIRNAMLRRQTAEQMARKEIGAFWQSDVEAMLVTYANSTTTGEGDKFREDQDVESAVRSLTKAELTGASIMEYWESPCSNEAYAIARLDSGKAFDNILKKLKDQKSLTEKEFQEIKQRKGEFLEDMDKRLKK